MEIKEFEHYHCQDAHSPTMETNDDAESQETLLRDHIHTSSKLKQKASTPDLQIAFSTGSERPYRDTIFTFFFLATILTIFTLGIIASAHRNTLNLDTQLRLSHFNPDTNKCEIAQQQPQQTPDEDPDSASAIVTLVAIALVTSLALTFPLSLLLISLLHRYTRPMVLVSAAVAAILPLALCISLFSSCRGFPDKGCAVLGPLWKRIFVLVAMPAWSLKLAFELRKNWNGSYFENGVRSLRMATQFLEEHFGLLIVNPVMVIAWMVFVIGPILTFMWEALNVGEIVPDFGVVNDPTKGCDELAATGSPCCWSKRPAWVYVYITFASITALWVLLVSLGFPRFVEGGTVSNWYFALTGSTTSGNIKRSLRNAYGPSFGTVCGGFTFGFILFIQLVNCLKKIGDRVVNSNHQSSLFQGCFLWMSQLPESQPMYASTYASISGDSFWESSKKIHNLLQRTSLPSTVTTEEPFHHSAIDSLVNMIVICTLLETLVVYAVLECFPLADSGTKVLITMFLCFPLVFCWLLSIFMGTISSVFITVYICYAMEKDVGEISKPEICHALLVFPPSSPENGA